MLLAALVLIACGGGRDEPAADVRAAAPAGLIADSAAAVPGPDTTDVPAQHGSAEQPAASLPGGPETNSQTGAAAADPPPQRQSGGGQAGASRPVPATGSTAAPAMPTGATPAGAPTAGPTETVADAAAVLQRASAAYGNVRSLRADFVMRREIPALRQTITSRGTLYQRSPDRVALRFSDPAGDVILSDGEYFWVYYPSVNAQQVLQQPAAEGGRSGVDLQAQFVGNPSERFNATLHGTETVGGRQAHVLTLIPRQRAEYRSLKVWLDTRDSLARRFEIVEHNGSTRHFDLENLQTNVSIPDATFRFTPPAGARIISGG
jgi:outer membrane lipoprotein carrier protein